MNPRVATSPSPVIASPTPIQTVPRAWSPAGPATTPDCSESSAARRARNANGSRSEGRNSAIASAMCDDEEDREKDGGHVEIVGAGSGRQAGRTASSATQSASCQRPTSSRPAASSAARTSASRSMKMPDATQRAARARARREVRRELDEDPGDQVREDEVERPARRSGRSRRARGSGAPTRLWRALAIGRLDRDRVDVDAEGPRRAELHRRDRQDPGAAADVEHARARAARGRPRPRAPRGTAASSGGGRSRTPSRGRGR